jgi:exodeoxyribonuclease VII small subunit
MEQQMPRLTKSNRAHHDIKQFDQSKLQRSFCHLKSQCQKLEDQTEPDIDHLLEVVEQSTAAYKICKARIDAVEKALMLTFESHD